MPQITSRGLQMATYAGPGSKNDAIRDRDLLRAGKDLNAISAADMVSAKHDYAYSLARPGTNDVREADKDMLRGLWKTASWRDPYSYINNAIAAGGILAKMGLEELGISKDTFTKPGSEGKS